MKFTNEDFMKQPEPNRQNDYARAILAQHQSMTKEEAIIHCLDLLQRRLDVQAEILRTQHDDIARLQAERAIYQEYLERDPLFRVWRRLFK